MYADGKKIVEIEKFLLNNKVYNNGKTIGHARSNEYCITYTISVNIFITSKKQKTAFRRSSLTNYTKLCKQGYGAI